MNDLNIPNAAINLAVKLGVKPLFKRAPFGDSGLDLCCQLFDPFHSSLDSLLDCETEIYSRDCGMEVEKIQSKRSEQKNELAIINIHGGGFLGFSPRSHRAISAYLSEYTGATVFAPNYTKSHRAKYPTQLNQCFDLFNDLVDDGYNPKNIFLVGDSAGGNLALATALKIRDEAPENNPGGVVLFSAWTDLALTGETLHTHRHKDKIIPTMALPKAVEMYGAENPFDPYVSPLYANFKGLCPVSIHVGDTEVLLDDSLRLWGRMIHHGVRVNCKVWKNACHSFPIFAKVNQQARDCLKHSSDFIVHFAEA